MNSCGVEVNLLSELSVGAVGMEKTKKTRGNLALFHIKRVAAKIYLFRAE
jgi:hypothetical protein